ncbi:MAG: PD-(D/E)XK nuclease family protein [Candidatus Aquirickettsiella sp.]
MEIYNKLFKRLNPEDLLLTGNKRLIPFLHKAYAQYQQKQKKQVWSTLQFFTFTRWLETLWEKQFIKQTGFSLRLLNQQQECLLWKIIIQQSAYSFLDTVYTAKNAQQAWQLLQQAQLDYQITHFKQSNETETWQTWATHFVSFCQTHALVDLSSALNHLILLFRKKILKPPPRIFLIGFNEINPQYKKLLKVLEEQHCEICHFAPVYSSAKQQRLCLSDKETEYHTMALWAYQSWQHDKKNIACVIPHLIEQRTHLLNTFTEVFTALAPSCMHHPPFNIAAGNPLLEFGLIQTAMLILGLEEINSFPQINLLLRSPYLGGSQQEQAARAQLDITLRGTVENRLHLDPLLRISNQHACPILSGLIAHLIPLIKKYPSHFLAKPSFWSAYFAKKLHALAWPGERLLNSGEFQLLERWSELLTELAGLDFILGNISHTAALQQLHEFIANTLFQTKTLHEPPIHVLGLLDSAGMYFDTLWVMGLDDRTWPAIAKPNPFIPYALQHAHQIPYASSEREYYFASLLTKNLIGCAENIIFSHPTQHLDQILHPSVLIKPIPEIELSDLKLPTYQALAKRIMTTQQWEYYRDVSVPLPAEDSFSGGTQLLQSQIACPFQAFARWRLKAQFQPFPQNGLNARERGILLHQVLEQFWNKVQDQSSLLTLTPSALDKLIHAAIEHCLNFLSKKRPVGFKTHFINIERQRLQTLLKNVIDLEKQRPVFMQTQHESKRELKLGRLLLTLRIDRLDQLNATQSMIIDYKTSAPSKIDWLEARCDYPQLPLYCLSYPETVRSFAIMHLRSNKITLQGISAEESAMQSLIPLKKLNTSLALNHWSDLLKHWQTCLEKIAKEFQHGLAGINPKHGPTTCRHCDLSLLCRIHHSPFNTDKNLSTKSTA